MLVPCHIIVVVRPVSVPESTSLRLVTEQEYAGYGLSVGAEDNLLFIYTHKLYCFLSYLQLSAPLSGLSLHAVTTLCPE
jgi:hypothetical protein